MSGKGNRFSLGIRKISPTISEIDSTGNETCEDNEELKQEQESVMNGVPVCSMNGEHSVGILSH